jgi:hypothetical protein
MELKEFNDFEAAFRNAQLVDDRKSPRRPKTAKFFALAMMHRKAAQSASSCCVAREGAT